MKKRIISILVLLAIVLFPSDASATNVSVSISCNTTQIKANTPSDTAICTVKGNVTGGAVSSIKGSISTSNLSVLSVQALGWSQPITSNDSFTLSNLTDKTGTFNVVQITVVGTNPNTTGTITISNIKGSDADYETYTSSNASVSLSVISPTTTTTTTKTTTRSTTVYNPPTSKTNQTTVPNQQTSKTNQTTVPNQQTSKTNATTVYDPDRTETNPTTAYNPDDPHANETTTIPYDLMLIDLKVDDFKVTYENGKYYVTVNYDTESVSITAHAHEGVQVIGAGNRSLSVGKNVAELVLINPSREQRTVQIIITRPEDTNTYNTALSKLKVVGYDIKFDSAKTKYKLSVPSNTEDLYIIAESVNKDVDITGAGLVTLKKGKNEIVVKVRYGDKASTEYVIEVTRDYSKTVLLVLLIVVSGGFGGFAVYHFLKVKKMSEVSVTVTDNEHKLFGNHKPAKETIKVGATTGVGVGASLSESKAEVMAFDSGKEITQNDRDILNRTIKSTLVQPTLVRPTEKTEPVKVESSHAPETTVQGYANPKQPDLTQTQQVRIIKTIVQPLNQQSTQNTVKTNNPVVQNNQQKL